MMKHDIGCFGFGAGGSNMVDEMYYLGYDSLIANTAPTDLSANDCPNKYHISGMFGCSKDRIKSLEAVGSRYKEIGDVIINHFYTKKVINLFTSMGGGSGSGGTPLVADYLSKKYPEKIFNIIAILPNFNESKKIKENALSFYEDLEKLDYISGIYMVDNNNNRNKFFINKKFAEFYDKYINISNPDKRGAIDPYERTIMTEAKGCVYMATIPDSSQFLSDTNSPLYKNNISINNNLKTNLGIKLNKQIYNNIFAPPSFGCKYLAISKAHDDITEGCLREIIGNPSEDEFVGYNNFDEHFIIATGMPLPYKRKAELIQSINEDEDRQDKIENKNETIEMPILRTKKKSLYQNNTPNPEKIDIQALMSKFR